MTCTCNVGNFLVRYIPLKMIIVLHTTRSWNICILMIWFSCSYVWIDEINRLSFSSFLRLFWSCLNKLSEFSKGTTACNGKCLELFVYDLTIYPINIFWCARGLFPYIIRSRLKNMNPANYFFVQNSYLFFVISIFFLWIKLIKNLFIQILVATPLETEQGHLKTFVVYFGGILFGALGSALFNPTQAMIGASAGVYSLLISHISHCVLVSQFKI